MSLPEETVETENLFTKIKKLLNKDKPDEKGLLSKQTLDTDIIRKHAQSLFVTNGTTQINPTIYKELEFFVSNDPSGTTQTLFDVINKCKTITGSEYLRNILQSPHHDLEILLQREHTRKYFRTLPSNVALDIKNILQQMTLDESPIYWMIRDKTPEMREVLDLLFFNKVWNKPLNTHESFLTAYFYFIMIFNPLWGIIGPFILLLIPYLVTRYIMNVPLPLSTYLESVRATLFGTQFFSMFKMGKAVFNTLSGESVNPSTQMRNALINKVFDIITSEFGRWVYLFILIAGYLWTIYNQIIVSQNFNKLINFIHARLNSIRKLIDNCKYIISLCDNPQTGLKCGEFSVLVADCVELLNTSPILQHICGNGAFVCQPGLISNKGAIIKGYYMMELENRSQSAKILTPFMRLMSYIDMWYSISCDISGGYCDARYLVDESPHINMSDLYCPAFTNCVSNSLELNSVDTDGRSNMLLTGPNGSGKSTFLKSFMGNILLSQTLGIAFANKCELTPFKYLSSYLNIPDCQGRESLFQAEMSRCHDHLKKLQEYEQDKQGFSFNIMDEIFVSTNYLEGMSGAYAVIKRLGQCHNACHIITTHFDKLVGPSQDQIPGYIYKHFQINMSPDMRDDSIKKDYKLYDGVNDKHLALHLLKLRGFDEALVAEARTMYNKLVSDTTSTTTTIDTIESIPSDTKINEMVGDTISTTTTIDTIESIPSDTKINEMVGDTTSTTTTTETIVLPVENAENIVVDLSNS